ncbi:MAG: AAA family ATPase, partial [Bryobacteraceae bacterium]
MKLTAFRIHRYKSIQDSGWVDVSSLTVVVGKNESGKTTMLKALHKFNPFYPEPYILEREWPRGQRRGRSDEQVVCSTRFELAADEVDEIFTLSGGKLIASDIEVSRDYRGRLEIQFSSSPFSAPLHPNAVDALCQALPEVAEPVGDSFREQVRLCREECRRLAHEGRFQPLAGIAATQIPALQAMLNPWNPAPSYENEQEYVRLYTAALADVKAAIPTLPAEQAAVHEALVTRIPAFLFMDEYRAFHGAAALDEVWQRKHQGQMTGEDRTLEMILELSGLHLEEEYQKGLKKTGREERQYDLDDAGVTLTKTIEGRWKQLRYEVKFAADAHQFFTFVKDHKDQSLIKLEERSKGFQWFFSFDLMLMYESRGSFKNCVILLDEPGLYLHPEAQRDLLQRLCEYAGNNTLIYSTHLPFMVDLAHPERIRVLNETKEGAIVTGDLTSCQPEAKFTLDAALAIAGSSSYLLSARNLVIEGAGDFFILSELSNLFLRSGLEGLPEDVLLTPASDAAQAGYIATLMVGRDLDVVVLLTSTGEGADGKEGLIHRWVSRYNATVAAEVLSLGG